MTQIHGHPAVKAWSKIDPAAPAPGGIEILKDKYKVKVYRLLGAGPDNRNVIAKGGLSDSLGLERSIYEDILPLCRCTSLQCYGFEEEGPDGFSWLFLEDAQGEPFDKNDRKHWLATERWLSRLHSSTLSEEKIALLPRRDPQMYYDLLEQSRNYLVEYLQKPDLDPDHRPILEETLGHLGQVDQIWPELRRINDQLPVTLVHGDLKLKNMRIREDDTQISVLPFDWEMGGWGTCLIDLGIVYFESPDKDLNTYWSMMRHLPPFHDQEDFRRILVTGGIWRMIISTYWAGKSLRSGYLVRLMGKLNNYNAQFSSLLTALQ